jgi:hypothetical protein
MGNGPRVPGNIDVTKIRPVKNADGTVSTVRSISVGTDSGFTLIPTVVGGRVVSNKDAISEYRRTRQHLGIFDNEDDATNYALKLHEQEALRVSRMAKPVRTKA